MIEERNSEISITQQCEMVNIARSSYYEHKSAREYPDREIKDRINMFYAHNPEYGSRRITDMLKRQGIEINRKRTQRLMREMNLQGISPKRKLSEANCEHKKYPLLLGINQ